jgi:hypothetical protein
MASMGSDVQRILRHAKPHVTREGRIKALDPGRCQTALPADRLSNRLTKILSEARNLAIP